MSQPLNAIPVSDVQKLHLLEQVQKFVGQVRPEALVMEVRDDLTLARDVALAQEHMLLQHRKNGFPHCKAIADFSRFLY